MAPSTVLIAGCGYVGSRLAEYLIDDGHVVHGLKRTPKNMPDGTHAIAADVTDPETLEALPTAVDALVYSVSPGGRSEEEYRAAYLHGFRNVLERLADTGNLPDRVILVSSTGIYGQTQGERVDEETPPGPSTPTGRVLLQAEEAALEASPATAVLRLGGIYGPGRTRIIEKVRSGEAGCPPVDRYSNRIHRDDAAGAMRHLLGLDDPERLYLGVDREPASLREVYRWIAARTGAPDPCRTVEADAVESHGRGGTNKRCLGIRLVESGYTFRYRSYREGYGALLGDRVG